MNDGETKAIRIGNKSIVLHQRWSRPELHIHADAGEDDGVYLPPQDMHLWGEQQISDLRDFLNEHYPKKETAK